MGDDVPLTTGDLNSIVVRDSLRTVIAQVVGVAVILWLAPRSHGLAVALFWFDAAAAGICVVLRVFMVISGVAILILEFIMRMGWDKPTPLQKAMRELEPARPRTEAAEIVRLLEVAVLVYSTYYLYVHLYSGSKFLGYFAE